MYCLELSVFLFCLLLTFRHVNEFFSTFIAIPNDCKNTIKILDLLI